MGLRRRCIRLPEGDPMGEEARSVELRFGAAVGMTARAAKVLVPGPLCVRDAFFFARTPFSWPCCHSNLARTLGGWVQPVSVERRSLAPVYCSRDRNHRLMSRTDFCAAHSGWCDAAWAQGRLRIAVR